MGNCVYAVPTRYSSVDELYIMLDLYKKHVLTVPNRYSELEVLYRKEFEKQLPMPQLDDIRKKVSDPVSPDFEILNVEKLVLLEDEELFDFRGKVKSVLSLPELREDLPDMAQARFTFECSPTMQDINDYLNMDLDDFVGNTDLIGQVSVDETAILSDEQISNLERSGTVPFQTIELETDSELQWEETPDSWLMEKAYQVIPLHKDLCVLTLPEPPEIKEVPSEQATEIQVEHSVLPEELSTDIVNESPRVADASSLPVEIQQAVQQENGLFYMDSTPDELLNMENSDSNDLFFLHDKEITDSSNETAESIDETVESTDKVQGIMSATEKVFPADDVSQESMLDTEEAVVVSVTEAESNQGVEHVSVEENSSDIMESNSTDTVGVQQQAVPNAVMDDALLKAIEYNLNASIEFTDELPEARPVPTESPPQPDVVAVVQPQVKAEEPLVAQQEQPVSQTSRATSEQHEESSKVVDVPKDIRAFLREHPRCTVSEALKYYSKEEISKALLIGKIVKRGNCLHI